MRKIFAALAGFAALLASLPAAGQAPTFNSTGAVVTNCGATSPFAAWVAGRAGPYTVNPQGQICITGSITASLAGFTPSATGARGTPVSVTTLDSSGTLPTGTVVVVTNVGTTNPMYCNVNGIAATTSDQLITANGGWFSFTIPAAITTLHCIATGGTTTANMVGGTGLATGTGGGSGGGGGGAITAASGAFASGSLSAGAMVDFLTVRGSKAPGTAAANSLLNGGIYTAAGVTLLDGQQAALQFDSAGNVKVVGTGVAAGSTTSGQTMSPVGCAVTTSAPSYTTAQTNFVSCDTAGNARTIAPATTNAGAAVVKGGVGVVNGGSSYQAVAASQTATVLQTSTGAIGDYLSHCVLYPTSTSPGVVTVFDNTNAAAGSAILFPGGASSLSNLAPIPIPVGAVSTAGAWKVTTGASISVVCYGKFS